MLSPLDQSPSICNPDSLVNQWLRGQKVTLCDKIRAETCLETLNAMQKAIAGRGELLSNDELRAFHEKRRELRTQSQKNFSRSAAQ